MPEYGLFNDDSYDWSEEEAIEADFWSIEEAEAAIRERYSSEDDLVIHEIEGADITDELNEEDDDDD